MQLWRPSGCSIFADWLVLEVAKRFGRPLWGAFRRTGALNTSNVPVLFPTSVPEGAARVAFGQRGPWGRSCRNRSSSHLFHQQSSLPFHFCCTSCCFRIHVQCEEPGKQFEFFSMIGNDHNMNSTCWVLGVVMQSYPDHQQQLDASSLLEIDLQALSLLTYPSLSSLPFLEQALMNSQT